MYFLFDLPVVLAFHQQDWEAWSRLGACTLAETSFEEIQFLTHRAADKATEQAARAFIAFYPQSNWQTDATQMAHPALAPKPGQALSKRARLLLSLAQCAHGASYQQPNQLVVVVSHGQSLVTLIQRLNVVNLCAISGTALKQWSRFGEQPEIITQTQHRLKSRGVVVREQQPPLQPVERKQPALPITQSVVPKSQAVMPAIAPYSTPHRRSTSQAQKSSKHPRSSKYRSPRPNALTQMMQLCLALLGLLVAIGLLIKLSAPDTFEQLWQKGPMQGQGQK